MKKKKRHVDEGGEEEEDDDGMSSGDKKQIDREIDIDVTSDDRLTVIYQERRRSLAQLAYLMIDILLGLENVRERYRQLEAGSVAVILIEIRANEKSEKKKKTRV